MKKRGFTLFELLAVIIILAVIALIVVPVIFGIIENSRKQSIAISGKAYVDYIDERLEIEQLNDNTFSDGKYNVINRGKKIQLNSQEMNIKMKGMLPVDGWVIIKDHQVIEALLIFGKYQYHYKLDNGKIIQEITKVGQVAPDIDLVLQSTTNTITATINKNDQYKINQYEYKLNDGNFVKSDSNQYVFTELESDREYTITVRCKNTTGGEITITGTIKTKVIDIPTYKIEPSSGWATEKTVTITYPKKSNQFVNPIYEYSLDGGETWKTVDSSSVDLKFTDNGSVIARVSDGNNYKTANSLSVEQIDNTPPTISNIIEKQYTSTINLSYIVEDSQSGIASVICEYGAISNYGRRVTGSSTGCSIGGLTANTTYYYRITATDNAGKTTSVTGSTSTLTPITPTFTTVATSGQISGSNYMTSQMIQVNYDSSNIYSGRAYYFKTTVNTTSNVAVSDCGTTTTTCSGSTTNITANRWYRTTSIAPQITFTQSGTIYAQISDGTNYKDGSTYTTAYITGISENDYAKSSLVAHLDGLSDGNTATTYNDLATHTNVHIDSTSGWANGKMECYAWDPNRGCLSYQYINGAILFDGIDDNLSFNWIINGKTSFTIETVFNPIEIKGNVITDANAAGIGIFGNGSAVAYMNNKYETLIPPAGYTKTNNIYYRAISIDSGAYSSSGMSSTFKSYSGEDTTLSPSSQFFMSSYVTQVPFKSSTAILKLGCNPSSNGLCEGDSSQYFHGYIYAVRIHNGVLTDQQIAKNAFIDRKRYGF